MSLSASGEAGFPKISPSKTSIWSHPMTKLSKFFRDIFKALCSAKVSAMSRGKAWSAIKDFVMASSSIFGDINRASIRAASKMRRRVID